MKEAQQCDAYTLYLRHSAYETTMDAIIHSQLDRVEAGLSTLIESISSYKPSVPAAEELVKADDELQQGLKQLHTHQQNHARILQLQDTIEQRNVQITSTFQQLVDTRAELLSISTSLPSKDRRDVEVAQLLDFAKHISQFNAPPTFKSATVQLPREGEAIAEDGDGAMEGIGLAALVEEEKRWLDPWTGVQMTPWPSEEVIRSSALSRMQAGETFGVEADDTKDEACGDPTDAMQLDEISGREQQVHMRGFRNATIKKDEKPKVFGGLDLYDPEDDE